MTHWNMLNKENSNLVALFNMSQCVICSPVWRIFVFFSEVCLKDFTARRALPWPPNKVFYKLCANQGVRISLIVTPACKVRTVIEGGE